MSVQGGGARGGGESRLAKLRIMSKEVTIACRAGEEDALKQAAAYIDGAMRELRSRNSTSSIEKIAIVTAINTADALLKARREVASSSHVDNDGHEQGGGDRVDGKGADGEHVDDGQGIVDAGAVGSEPLRARIAGLSARVDALLEQHAPAAPRHADPSPRAELDS